MAALAPRRAGTPPQAPPSCGRARRERARARPLRARARAGGGGGGGSGSGGGSRRGVAVAPAGGAGAGGGGGGEGLGARDAVAPSSASTAGGVSITPGATAVGGGAPGARGDGGGQSSAADAGGDGPAGARAVEAWVALMNAGLRASAGGCLVAFVLLDAGSALCLWALLHRVVAVSVPPEFVLAYGLSKAIRVPRLALDAVAAAALARACPALARVDVGLMIDAGERALGAGALWLSRSCAAVVRACRHRAGAGELAVGEATGPTGSGGSVDPAGSTAERVSERPAAVRRAGEITRAMTSEYGLAYMTAKNVIGPLSAVLFFIALRKGVDLEALLGRFVGEGLGGNAALADATGACASLCLAAWSSALLFPLVVTGAALLGPRIGRLAGRARARLARA